MRVKAVVGTSIMVNIRDVKAGDIIYICGNERDRIVESVEEQDGKIRFHYVYQETPQTLKDLGMDGVQQTTWMAPEADEFGNGCCFIHDLHRERFEFLELQEA